MTLQIFINMVKEWVIAQGYTTLALVLAAIQGTRMYAYRTSSSQSIATSDWTEVELNTKSFDTKNEMHLEGHRWTCKTAGYYDISYGVGCRAGIPDGKRLQVALYINNSLKAKQIAMSSADEWFTVNGSRLLYFTVNDWVELWTWHDAGVGVNLDYTNKMCFLCMHRLP